MNDHRDLKMFVREGRNLILSGLGDTAKPIGIVTPWRDDQSEEQNVAALRDLGTPICIELQEPEVRAALMASGHQNLPLGVNHVYVCGKDDKGPCAYLLLFCRQISAQRSMNLIHQTCRRIVKQFQQPGHVEWDGRAAMLFDRDGGEARLLRPFDGAVERLDEWFSHVRPGFQAAGVFDRNFSFVQKRWYETQPRPGQGDPPTPEEEP